jgi:DNA-binding PadR family transcriptional regulator
VADLKPRERTQYALLSALARDPKVSTWDMEKGELWRWFEGLERDGYIKSVPCGYPWHEYELTDKGREMIREKG